MTTTYSEINNSNALIFFCNKLLRLSTTAGLGILMTGLLLFIMCSLVAMEPVEIVDQKIQIKPIVMPEDRSIDERIEHIIEKPLPPEVEPVMPKTVEPFENVDVLPLVMLQPTGPGEIDLQTGMDSGSAIAIFKVAPNYPRRPQSRGIEGFVDLMFDINTTGKTENIRVLHAEPAGAFERSSIKALSKWKYKPAMDDGVARRQENQTTRMTYELEK